jgi:hypothetical protein
VTTLYLGFWLANQGLGFCSAVVLENSYILGEELYVPFSEIWRRQKESSPHNERLGAQLNFLESWHRLRAHTVGQPERSLFDSNFYDLSRGVETYESELEPPPRLLYSDLQSGASAAAGKREKLNRLTQQVHEAARRVMVAYRIEHQELLIREADGDVPGLKLLGAPKLPQLDDFLRTLHGEDGGQLVVSAGAMLKRNPRLEMSGSFSTENRTIVPYLDLLVLLRPNFRLLHETLHLQTLKPPAGKKTHPLAGFIHSTHYSPRDRSANYDNFSVDELAAQAQDAYLLSLARDQTKAPAERININFMLQRSLRYGSQLTSRLARDTERALISTNAFRYAGTAGLEVERDSSIVQVNLPVRGGLANLGLVLLDHGYHDEKHVYHPNNVLHWAIEVGDGMGNFDVMFRPLYLEGDTPLIELVNGLVHEGKSLAQNLSDEQVISLVMHARPAVEQDLLALQEIIRPMDKDYDRLLQTRNLIDKASRNPRNDRVLLDLNAEFSQESTLPWSHVREFYRPFPKPFLTH